MSPKPGSKKRRNNQPEEEKKCYLCENKLDSLDYKDVNTLKLFITLQGKIKPPRKTGTCARHQRLVARTVKRARTLAIVPVKRG